MVASGFASLLFETLWIRVLSMVLAGTVHAFSIMVAAFIAGISIGARWAGTRTSTWQESARLLARAELWVAGLVALAFGAYQRLPWIDLRVSLALAQTDSGYAAHLAFELALSFVVMAVPAMAIGATLPAAARVTAGAFEALGRDFGGIYAWNTAGNVAGALLGGFVVLPLLGLKGAFLFGVAVNVACALLLTAHIDSAGAVRRVALGSAALLALLAAAPFETRLLSRGLFRQRGSDPGEVAEFEQSYLRDTKRLFHADGASATVDVNEWKDGERALVVNGKADASTRSDLQTQLMVGHVPMLLHPAPRDVLIVGFGSGATVAAALAHGPDVRVTVLEISPEVIEAAPFFAEVNDDCLSDPRVRLVLDDARTFIRLTRERFDVVINEPSNPWMSGISGLFTADFAREAKAVLREGGAFVQWVQLYETHDEVVRTILRSTRSSFAELSGWATGNTDFMVVAGPDPAKADWDAIRARVSTPSMKRSLEKARIRSVAGVAMLHAYDSGTLARFAGTGPLHEDAWPTLEYDAARYLYLSSLARDLLRADQRLWPRRGSNLSIFRVRPLSTLGPAEALELSEVVRSRVTLLDSVQRSFGLHVRTLAGVAGFAAVPDFLDRYPDVLFDDPVLPPVPAVTGDVLVKTLVKVTEAWSERTSAFRMPETAGLNEWLDAIAAAAPLDPEACRNLVTDLKLLAIDEGEGARVAAVERACGPEQP